MCFIVGAYLGIGINIKQGGTNEKEINRQQSFRYIPLAYIITIDVWCMVCLIRMYYLGFVKVKLIGKTLYLVRGYNNIVYLLCYIFRGKNVCSKIQKIDRMDYYGCIFDMAGCFILPYEILKKLEISGLISL